MKTRSLRPSRALPKKWFIEGRGAFHRTRFSTEWGYHVGLWLFVGFLFAVSGLDRMGRLDMGENIQMASPVFGVTEQPRVSPVKMQREKYSQGDEKSGSKGRLSSS